MALSKSESKKEVSNLACIARILLGPCTDTLRDVLTQWITLPDLKIKLRYILEKAYKPEKYFIGFQLLIYKYGGNYSDFDIPLLYFFLNAVCNFHLPPPEWGPFSRKEGGILSANIKRIYQMNKKYKYFQGDFLKDSAFEQDWEELFQTVKELEKYIGSATANQDAMKKIKNSSMDPDVEHLFIAKLGQSKRGFQHGMPPFPYLWTNIEMMLTSKTEAQVYASRSIEAYLERFGERSLDFEKALGLPESFWEIFRNISIQRTSTAEAVDEGSGIMEELHIDQTKIMETGAPSWGRLQSSGYPSVVELHDDISESTGEESYVNLYIPPKYEQITSETLKELFACYKVDFPTDVPGCESIARKILEDDIKLFVHAIRTLSKRIVLSSSKKAITAMPQVEVCVFEVEVVYDDGGDGKEETQICVFRKDTSLSMLCDMEKDTRIRVILIRSESIPVVSSKLFVYKNFKHAINEKRIFLQHEYDDFDDLAKLIAYRLFSSFCSSVESIVNAFTMDLQKIMLDNCDRQMTVEEIEQTCLDVLNKTADKHRFWPIQAVNMIKSKLSKEELLGEEAWSEIQKACQQTVTDLKVILSRLEEFQTEKLQVDQRKEIDEWFKREVIEDKASLYPSIIKYIAGQRGDKNVVKVYLSGGNTEDAKEALKYEFNLAITDFKFDFEFVNIEEIIEMPKDVQKIKALEREAPEIDISTRENLESIIRKHTDKLYARYSNIIGIRIGRRVHGDKLEEPCIIFYCLDKSLIPFGEKEIPDSLEGWPCGVREDFIMLGRCTENCRTTTADYPELGCSIGMPSDKGFGSVGFMFESDDSKEYGFLTAAHVVIKNCQQLYRRNNLLSEHPLRNETHDIVHPSWTDNEYNDFIVGQVMEAFYGNYTSFSEGLDFAAIKTNCKKEDKEDIEVFNEDNTILKKMVRKTGRTTGLTSGLLSNRMESIRIEKPHGSMNCFQFYNLYVVDNIAGEDQLFFKPGDSGSGVFVVEEGKPDKALGIGIAIAIFSQETYVCKIANILNTLGLKLVRYRDNNQEQTSPSTIEEKM